MSFQPIPITELNHSQVFFTLKVPRGGIIFLYVLVFILITGIAYSIFGTIDEWASGTAMLRPEQEVSIVRNEAPGRVSIRHVNHGEGVEAGALLWSIDVSAADAELESLEKERTRLQNEQTELHAILQSLVTNRDLVPAQLTHAVMQLELIRLEKQRIDLQVSGARQAYLREDQHPASIRRADRVEEFLRSYQLLQIEASQFLPREIITRQERLRAIDARISEIDQILLASRARLLGSSVRAPISGTFEFVREVQVGEYLSNAEEVARIVPDQAHRFRLIIDVPEREASELKLGQEMVLRFSGFPVSEFDSVRATVSYIPQDAEMSTQGTVVYRLWGALEQTTISNKDGQIIPLRPGMTAEARIITRRTPLYRFILRKLDVFL